MENNDDKYVDMMYGLDPTLIYITTSQVHHASGQANETKDTKLIEAINNHCTCDNCDSTCKCIQTSGISYSNEGLLSVTSDKPAFECNFQCKCSNDCKNRLTSKGPNPQLTIKPTACKNYGLFATENIAKGNFICEYAGEIITNEEAKQRGKIYKERKLCNYIFWLREAPNEVNKKWNREIVTIVDPTVVGNIGKYINHSCEPNCQVVPVRCDSVHPKLCIFAQRGILRDEEVTFDYGNVFEENLAIADSLNSDNSSNRVICKCNSKNCKKFLPFHG